jgi:hypothetical protein
MPVVCEQFDQAEDFLNHLVPWGNRWQPVPGCWWYRGHADASWELRASIYRDGALDRVCCPLWDPPYTSDWRKLHGVELFLLEQFQAELGKVGHPTPYGDPELALGRREAPNYSSAEVSPYSWPLLALAQHHGVPTTLLDWTGRALVAAYFAAEGATGASSGIRLSVGHLGVWALQSPESEINPRNTWPCTSSGNTLHYYRAPRGMNPYLHHQDGRFTMFRGREDPMVPTVDEHIREERGSLARQLGVSFPIMRQLLLPHEQAPRLLRLLAEVGVSGSSVWPTPDGAVRAMRERRLWDHPTVR